jgi:hypothetical protein
MNKFPFISDIVLVVARSETPSTELLREVAEQLDFVVLFPVAFREYVGAVRRRLAPLHAKFEVDSSGRQKPLDDLPYLAIRDDAFFDDVVQEPFSSRSDEWLRLQAVHMLALNLPALEELQDRVLEEMPRRWVELLDDEQWMRKFGMPPIEANELSIALGKVPSEAGGILESQVRGSSHKSKPRAIRTSHTFSLSDATQVEGAENVSLDEGTLHIERAGRTLKIRAAGMLFVDAGCELSVRWLKDDGRTLNGPAAQQSIRDRDQVIALSGEDEALAGQWIEFQFKRSGHRPYAFAGRIEL